MTMLPHDPDRNATEDDVEILGADLRTEMADLRTELRTGLAEVRTDFGVLQLTE
ncbi:MAG TPA: hypothetical protein VMW08_01565 [Acidimicrobiales bacterium]|nr:hypothetical protein [Acidimicrobiales bacterium]